MHNTEIDVLPVRLVHVNVVPDCITVCEITLLANYNYKIIIFTKKVIKLQFLSRVSTLSLTRAIDIAVLSVCLSVHLSVVRLSVCPSVRNAPVSVCLSVCPSVRNAPVSVGNCLTYCHSFFHCNGRPIILVLPASKFSQNSDGVTPCRGDKYRWGMKISRFSTNK